MADEIVGATFQISDVFVQALVTCEHRWSSTFTLRVSVTLALYFSPSTIAFDVMLQARAVPCRAAPLQVHFERGTIAHDSDGGAIGR
jgi:hypothetical protein